jgi:hypothetical protein
VFEHGLHVVNRYYQCHASYRTNWKLTAGREPQRAEDRQDPERVNYLGTPRRHTYYSYSLFQAELKNVRAGATPRDATELEFDTALRLTSARGANTAVVRNYQRPQYSGPQKVVQRDQIENLELEPQLRRSGNVIPGSTRGFDEIQCHDCGRWRRVDEATLKQFQNRTWWCDRYEERRTNLLDTTPHLLTALESWLPQVHAQQELQGTERDEKKLQVADADEFLFRRGYDGVVLPLHERAWHELLSDLCV